MPRISFCHSSLITDRWDFIQCSSVPIFADSSTNLPSPLVIALPAPLRRRLAARSLSLFRVSC